MHFKPMGPGSAVSKLESVSLNKKGGCQKIYRVNKEKEEGGRYWLAWYILRNSWSEHRVFHGWYNM